MKNYYEIAGITVAAVAVSCTALAILWSTGSDRWYYHLLHKGGSTSVPQAVDTSEVSCEARWAGLHFTSNWCY